MKELRFKDKVAVITGGASGMGFLCGKCFYEEGAKVALLDINEIALKNKVNELDASSDKVIGIKTDIRNYDEIVHAREEIVKKFGAVDIVINCAGGAATRVFNCHEEFVNVPIEVYDWGLDVNLKGPFYMNHVMMKQMIKQKSGVIINFGSITGEEGNPAGVDYASAKSGVMYGMTKSLAQYGAQYGIRVCCVSPGPVLTREAMKNMSTLIGRAADPQEIVDLVLYLSSDRASFITGTNYLIDGGRLIMKEKKG